MDDPLPVGATSKMSSKSGSVKSTALLAVKTATAKTPCALH
jgi:hypothetical protein